MMRTRAVIAMCVVATLLLGGCANVNRATPVATEHIGPSDLSAVALSAGEPLRVVATTTIVGDVVHNVGGDRIALTTLLPTGADPHTFEATPRDVATIGDAHVVFVNGAGLELFLERLLHNAGSGIAIVDLSHGLHLLEGGEDHLHEAHSDDHGDDDHSEADQLEEPGPDHEHEGADPHVWFDPHNVMVWADEIADALSALDPEGASVYRANAAAYKGRLEKLDRWIEEQVAQVPAENRRLVTDHTAFTYFAARYGFEQVGALLPGTSTLAETSAQELAQLEAAILEYDVKAIFVGLTVNPSLAERVAQDTGVQLVFLYTGSLSEPGGPASDYISMMEYNVGAIVAALR